MRTRDNIFSLYQIGSGMLLWFWRYRWWHEGCSCLGFWQREWVYHDCECVCLLRNVQSMPTAWMRDVAKYVIACVAMHLHCCTWSNCLGTQKFKDDDHGDTWSWVLSACYLHNTVTTLLVVNVEVNLRLLAMTCIILSDSTHRGHNTMQRHVSVRLYLLLDVDALACGLVAAADPQHVQEHSCSSAVFTSVCTAIMDNDMACVA